MSSIRLLPWPVIRPAWRTCLSSTSPHSLHRLQSTTTTTAAAAASHSTEETATETRARASSPSHATYYSLFPNSLPHGPPPQSSFDIDLSALKKEFLQLQARAHPDLHPPAHKKRAEAQSSHINQAYKTLQDPLRRAHYLLALRNMEVGEEEMMARGSGEGNGEGNEEEKGKGKEESDLLMQVLEAREQIEEAQQEQDLGPVRAANQTRMAQSVRALAAAFQADDLASVRREVVRLRYWRNIDESIREWEEQQQQQY